MRYLHTMLRVRNLDQALDFYCNKLGLKEVRRREDEKGRYTNVFLAAPDDPVSGSKDAGRGAPMVELTYNWDTEDYGEARYFGHLAYEVDDIYALCERLHQAFAQRIDIVDLIGEVAEIARLAIVLLLTYNWDQEDYGEAHRYRRPHWRGGRNSAPRHSPPGPSCR